MHRIIRNFLDNVTYSYNILIKSFSLVKRKMELAQNVEKRSIQYFNVHFKYCIVKCFIDIIVSQKNYKKLS